MNPLLRLLRYIRPYRKEFALSLALVILFIALQSIATTLTMPLFDKVLKSPTTTTSVQQQQATPIFDLTGLQSKIPGGKQALSFMLGYLDRILNLIPGSIITQLSVAFLCLYILKGVCLYYSSYLMSRVGQGVVTDLRNVLFDHVLSQSMSFFSLNSTGKLMSRVGNDVEQVQESVSTVLADLFREVLTLVALLSVIFIFDWKLALLSLTIAPFAFALTFSMGKRIRRVSLTGRQDAANLNDQLQQSITGIRIIKAFAMEPHEQSEFQKIATRLLRSNMKALSILLLNAPIMEVLGVLAFIPLLYYAHSRINSGTLTFGMFGVSLFSLFQMYDPIRKLSRSHVQFQRALASASRISELMDTHLEIQDRPDARILEKVYDSIEFRNVSFDYVDQNGETHVLRDINLKVGKNKMIAIVGSSGAGKTTLGGLIPRFYDPTAGSVLIDGTDIREYTQSSLRKQIAIVTQDTFLFNDTVRNNIAYGNMNATEAMILESSRAALADDFINRFPMKYDTLIGERGQRLSGGERQRIAIARALLKNAPILILDEATSSLDSESEKLVQVALGNLMRDRTTFVIAHRLSTIRNADRIIVIDRGRIVESGDHESLMSHDGFYRRFFRLQTDEALVQSAT
jgi:ATP-binding cassette, subfamily B, bacterial MsbA